MKVAISGAGIAGPTLAYWLERGGHEPTLIEKAPRLRTGGYVIDFWGAGYTVAEKMGILPAVREAGYQVRDIRLVDRRGRKVGGFSADVFRRMTGARFTSLPRGDLAATIFGALGDRVETIFDDGISAVEQRDASVAVRLERGGEREFDLLVGADGLHSNVRSLVFGPESRFERRLGYRVAAFEVEGYRPRDELAYVSHTVPGRQVARFSLRGDRTVFFFIFADETMDGPDPHETGACRTILREVFGHAGWECPAILEAMEGVEDIYFDRVSQIRMDRWSRGRVILIGDAASCISLLGGEGAGLAMTEAYVLSGELARAGDDHRAAFDRHKERLRAFVEGKQKAALNFASAFAPKTPLGVWVRNQATRLMAIPPVANLLIGRDLRDEIDLPDYSAWVSPDAADRAE